MAENPTKKASWPLSERAADLEASKTYQHSQGTAGDTRQQTDRKPNAKAQKMAKKRS